MLSYIGLLLLCFQEQPEVVRLWQGKAPLSASEASANIPSLTVYLPEKSKASGAAVVVCPGGGYGFLASGHEGTDVARWLNERGIAAFVLKYCTVSKHQPAPLMEAPLLDAQRAIRLVRANASQWNIDAKKVGICGFSAGGHLASTAATHFDLGKKDGDDSIVKMSCRPDFAILCYPVISMKSPHTHQGSRNNLLGKNPDEKLVELFCNDLQVTKETPPTFLFHTDEDKAVPPMNSILFYAALKKQGVPAELHIYEKGVHGVGLAPETPPPGAANYVPRLRPVDKGLSTWPDRLNDWLSRQGLVK